MDNLEKQLNDKIAQLKRVREELTKGWLGGDAIEDMDPETGYPYDLIAKDEDKKMILDQHHKDMKHDKDEDKKKNKKMIEAKLDDHNEKKHGEDKDEDSAMEKADDDDNVKVKHLVSGDHGHEYAVHHKGKHIGNIHHAPDGTVGSSLHEKYWDTHVEEKANKQVNEHMKKPDKNPMKKNDEEVKFQKNGQWSLDKAKVIDIKSRKSKDTKDYDPDYSPSLLERIDRNRKGFNSPVKEGRIGRSEIKGHDYSQKNIFDEDKSKKEKASKLKKGKASTRASGNTYSRDSRARPAILDELEHTGKVTEHGKDSDLVRARNAEIAAKKKPKAAPKKEEVKFEKNGQWSVDKSDIPEIKE